jgi:hypothetical protein
MYRHLLLFMYKIKMPQLGIAANHVLFPREMTKSFLYLYQNDTYYNIFLKKLTYIFPIKVLNCVIIVINSTFFTQQT